jgi:hypothetical protein
MTTTERPKMPPIVCAPWCEDGDGHTREFMREDSPRPTVAETVFSTTSCVSQQTGRSSGRTLSSTPPV